MKIEITDLRNRLVCFCLAIFVCQMWEDQSQAQVTEAQKVFFETKIQSVLESKCYRCHSEAEGKRKGGLLLDSRAAMVEGGDTGPALVPGSVAKSLLIEAIAYENPDMEMPPKEKLSDEIIEDFKKWVQFGAPDPRVSDIPAPQPKILSRPTLSGKKIENARDFWSFKSPRVANPAPVKQSEWPNNKVDHYILAQLERHGLEPAGMADRATLIRRAYFDLIGLPPSPEVVQAFEEDEDPAAFDKVIQELLTSEHFGERWGRHWLDVARYAESNGKGANVTYPHAWRYRNYVIDSFNADKPYDEFVHEQVAGDLLPASSAAEKSEHAVATGFLAIGPKSLIERNREKMMNDLVDEQIDAVTQAFLGLTVACARCHDHKFDPITAQDYYAMAGIFKSSNTEYGTVVQTDFNLHSDRLVTITVEDDTAAAGSLDEEGRKKIEQEIAEAEQKLRELRPAGPTTGGKGGKGGKGKGGKGGSGAEGNGGGGGGMMQIDEVTLRRMRIQLTRQIDHLKAELDSYDETGMARTLAMGMVEGDPIHAHLLERGEETARAGQVKRGFVQFLEHRNTPSIPSGSSGRLELAQWLTDTENPLTARVMMNRIWKHLFGNALVTSTNNFGAMGQPPTHPALMDYLALTFQKSGWSIKKMIRGLMLTKTYQMASTHHPANYELDPDNIYLWRATKKRLEAEILRDSVLYLSGNLGERPQTSQISDIGDMPIGGRQGRRVEGQIDFDVTYRSVYLPIVRDLVPDSLALFDFAEPSIIGGSRNDTIVPAQALYMMNSDFIQGYSDLFGDWLLESEDDLLERVRVAYQWVFTRQPSDEEEAMVTQFLKDYEAVGSDSEAMSAFVQSLFANAEFRYVN